MCQSPMASLQATTGKLTGFTALEDVDQELAELEDGAAEELGGLPGGTPPPAKEVRPERCI